MEIEHIKEAVEQIVAAHDEYKVGIEQLVDDIRKRLPENDKITEDVVLVTAATTEMNSALKQLLEALGE